MNLSGNHEEWTVTQTALSRILGLTVGRINQLIDEEIVVRDASSKNGAVLLVESLKNYYLSKNSLTDDKGKSVNYWVEHGLHERAKRKMAELKLRERKGELYAAETVERVMIEQLTNFRNKLLGLPAKFAAQLEGKSRAEIENCLEELAQNYKNANLRGEENDDLDDETET